MVFLFVGINQQSQKLSERPFCGVQTTATLPAFQFQKSGNISLVLCV